MRDVETQALGRDQRTLLRHMGAEHLAQSLVQQVGRRVVGAQPRTAGMIDRQHDRIAVLDHAVDDNTLMHEQAFASLLRI